jgi:hypothetical protein
MQIEYYKDNSAISIIHVDNKKSTSYLCKRYFVVDILYSSFKNRDKIETYNFSFESKTERKIYKKV